LLAAVLWLNFASGTSAQQQTQTRPVQDDEVVRVNTNLVQVDAVVTDKDGRQVTDLHANDFEIVEDGRTRQPDYCSYVALGNSPAPANGDAHAQPTAHELRRTFAFVISNPIINIGFSSAGANGGPPSTGSFMTQQRAQAAAEETNELLTWFVDKQMTERDLAVIADTDVDLGVLASYTNDRAVLHAAIKQVRANPTNGRSPVIRIMVVNGEAVLQPLLTQNLRVLDTLGHVIAQVATLPGRKVVAFVARGLLYDPALPYSEVVRARLQQLIEQANRAHIAIYTLRPVALNPNGNNFGDDGLIHLAAETGGRALYNTNDLRVGFNEVLEENRGYYLLAYNPGAEAAGRPHQIKVRVKRPGLHVQARTTVYAANTNKTAAAASLSTAADMTAAALNSPLAERDLKLTLTPLFISPDGLRARLVTLLHVALADVALHAQADGTQTGTLDLFVRVTAPDGHALRQEGRTLALKFNSDELARVRRDGLASSFELDNVSPGFYRVGVAVREPESGRTGSATRFVEVADLARHALSASSLLLSSEPAAAQSATDAATPAATDIQHLARREFAPGSLLHYQCFVYHAQAKQHDQPAQLEVQVTLKRGAETLASAPPRVITQTAVAPIFVGGAIPLTDLPSGRYTLELAITDTTRHNARLINATDFEIAAPH
jgi:VWFA-related protein